MSIFIYEELKRHLVIHMSDYIKIKIFKQTTSKSDNVSHRESTLLTLKVPSLFVEFGSRSLKSVYKKSNVVTVY